MKSILCTVVTPSHLHLAVNLARSVRNSWPEPPELWIALVGGSGIDLPPFDLPTCARLLPAEELAIPNLGWLAGKYTASELCCATKPFLLIEALRAGAEIAIYSDADQHFFAEPRSLIELARDHSF